MHRRAEVASYAHLILIVQINAHEQKDEFALNFVYETVQRSMLLSTM